MVEKTIEAALKNGCKKRGLLCLKFVSPGFTGVPDRIVLVPGGTAVFVELKAPNKRERSRQIYVQDVIRKYGFRVFESVDSLEKVEEVISECLKLK